MNRRIRFLKANYSEVFSKPVLDVGCGGGIHLSSFHEESVGMDGRALESPKGQRVVKWNFEDDISRTLANAGQSAQFEYVWCNDVFEHVLAPHMFLLNLRRVLADDGLLFLGVPLVNPLAFPKLQTRNNVFNLFCGFLSQDHVNFFTFNTIRHTVAFAGFHVDGWYSPFLPGKRAVMFGLEPVTTLVLRKIPGFKYGPKAYKELDERGELKWKELIA